MKSLMGAIKRWGKNVGVDERALKRVDQIGKGEKTERAPRHPTEAKILAESTADKDKIREELDRKYAELDENLRRIEVKVSSIPAKTNPSDRLLPSRESEYRHRNDQPWEFGFYEPPVEGIAHNRLTFREALTLMKAHVEIKNKGHGSAEAEKILHDHPAVQRVDPDHIERILKYFLPFETVGEQKFITASGHNHELLREAMGTLEERAEKMDEWKERLEQRRFRESMEADEEWTPRQIEEGPLEKRPVEGDKEKPLVEKPK